MKKNAQGSVGDRVLNMALNVLQEWEDAQVSIDDILDSRRGQSAKQQAYRICSNLVFNYFRHKAVVDAIIAKLAKKVKPKFRRLLALVITQCRHQSGITPESAINIAVNYAKQRFGSRQAGFINAVLRNSQKLDLDEFRRANSKSTQINLPATIYSRWSEQFGPEMAANLAALLSHEVPLTFRVIDPSLKPELTEELFVPLKLPEWAADQQFYCCRDNAQLFKTDWLTNGRIYIQDPSTVAFASLLPENCQPKRILDLCAAPGGKSLALAERFKHSLLVASDRSPIRQKRTLANFAKAFAASDAERLYAVVSDATFSAFRNGSFDLVLADVPCSNTGVFRRRPDTLWRFDTKRLAELVELQGKILESAGTLVAPNGYLLYSTCSIDEEENGQQVQSFIMRNPGFRVEKYLHILPEERFDGTYCALMQHQN